MRERVAVAVAVAVICGGVCVCVCVCVCVWQDNRVAMMRLGLADLLVTLTLTAGPDTKHLEAVRYIYIYIYISI